MTSRVIVFRSSPTVAVRLPIFTFIASSGEFTPRNLQTQEDRVQQVFEVKVHTTSAGGKLRAGMAADVVFSALSK